MITLRLLASLKCSPFSKGGARINQIRSAAAFKGGVQSTGKRRFRIPVNEDAHHIVNYVSGSNIYKTGEDIKIKDDSHYPDWIFTMKIDGPPVLEDYDPSMEEYWEVLHHNSTIRARRLESYVPKQRFVVGDLMKKRLEYQQRVKFRALASYDFEPGIDPKDWQPKADKKLWLKPQESLAEEELYPDQLAKESFHKLQDVYRPDTSELQRSSRHKRRFGRERKGLIL